MNSTSASQKAFELLPAQRFVTYADYRPLILNRPGAVAVIDPQTYNFTIIGSELAMHSALDYFRRKLQTGKATKSIQARYNSHGLHGLQLAVLAAFKPGTATTENLAATIAHYRKVLGELPQNITPGRPSMSTQTPRDYITAIQIKRDANEALSSGLDLGFLAGNAVVTTRKTEDTSAACEIASKVEEISVPVTTEAITSAGRVRGPQKSPTKQQRAEMEAIGITATSQKQAKIVLAQHAKAQRAQAAQMAPNIVVKTALTDVVKTKLSTVINEELSDKTHTDIEREARTDAVYFPRIKSIAHDLESKVSSERALAGGRLTDLLWDFPQYRVHMHSTVVDSMNIARVHEVCCEILQYWINASENLLKRNGAETADKAEMKRREIIAKAQAVTHELTQQLHNISLS